MRLVVFAFFLKAGNPLYGIVVNLYVRCNCCDDEQLTVRTKHSLVTSSVELACVFFQGTHK